MADKKETKPTGLQLLREPFPPHQISKLPKPTKAQTEAVRKDYKKGIRCELCGSWHHPEVIHLDYVGHAALTDRFLDVDPNWYWEPIAFNEQGLPTFDERGGLWIRLHILGHSRIGYGNAARKNNEDPGNREKEVIGDALRNAGMRFGAALELWHKGDLHGEEGEAEEVGQDLSDPPQRQAEPKVNVDEINTLIMDSIANWEHLSDAQRDFVTQQKERVAQYGDKVNITEKQVAYLNKLAAMKPEPFPGDDQFPEEYRA